MSPSGEEDSGARTGPPAGDPHLSDDVCLGLILGLLSDSEAHEILRHVESCATCEQLLRQRSAGWERSRIEEAPVALPVDDVRLDWRARLRALLASGRPRLALRGGLVGAAAAAILLIVLLPQSEPDPNVALLHWLPTISGFEATRALPRYAPSEELLAGFEAYAHRDMERAVALLGDVDVEAPLESMRRIYLGSALAWLGRYDDAASLLEAVPYELLPEPWSGESQWTFYVALRGAHRRASADSLLQMLADAPGELGERAKRILQSDGRR